jgi:hypothetical protein
MCTAGGSSSAKSAPTSNANNLQYKQSDQAKSASKQYQSLDERYKRWAAEDLGSFSDIDRRVNEAQSAFNAREEARFSHFKSSPLGSSMSKLLLGAVPRQQFNAGQMRQDLISQAVMDRVNSGVYNRGYQVTGTGQTSQASVVAGGGGRAQARDRLSISKAGGGTPTGPIGTNLNIGK